MKLITYIQYYLSLSVPQALRYKAYLSFTFLIISEFVHLQKENKLPIRKTNIPREIGQQGRAWLYCMNIPLHPSVKALNVAQNVKLKPTVAAAIKRPVTTPTARYSWRQTFYGRPDAVNRSLSWSWMLPFPQLLFISLFCFTTLQKRHFALLLFSFSLIAFFLYCSRAISPDLCVFKRKVI